MKFPFTLQKSQMDCGPTCLYMIGKFYGRNLNMQSIVENTEIGKDGVNLLGLSTAAEKIGFRTLSVEISFDKLINEAPLPCIVHWEQKHFVVVIPRSNGKNIIVADPAYGIIKYNKDEFCSRWMASTSDTKGIALLIEPTPAFSSHLNSQTPNLCKRTQTSAELN
jgi:ATP-binding cassette subfamily B protein